MGPRPATGTDPRVVKSDECSFADTRWDTPSEIGTTGPTGTGGPRQPSEFCPLILDLNGDGIHTTSLLDPAYFADVNDDGIADPSGWTDPTTEEGFLWLDMNGSGEVDYGELFGTRMRLPNGVIARNGFQALSVYDDLVFGGNGDGVASSSDAIWRDLRIWIDRNHDGASQPSEISKLDRFHIEEIGLAFEHEHTSDGRGNMVMLVGFYLKRHGNIITPHRADDIGFRSMVP